MKTGFFFLLREESFAFHEAKERLVLIFGGKIQ